MNDQHRLNTSKQRKQKSYKTFKILNMKTKFYKPPNYVATRKIYIRFSNECHSRLKSRTNELSCSHLSLKIIHCGETCSTGES